MNGVRKLKEKLKNDKNSLNLVRNIIKNVKSEKEAVELAKKLGFKVSEEDILKDEELNEDMLEAVAGGKGDTRNITQFMIDDSVKDYNIAIDEKTGKILEARKKERSKT